MKTKLQAANAMVVLRPFIGRNQMKCIASLCYGEEKQFFFDKLCEMADLVTAMPATYDQDGKGDQAIVTLHYFTAGADWWITEKDKGSPDDEVKGQQHQAFGIADLGYGPESGYISIVELLECGGELDLHFTPKTIAAMNGEKERVAA